METLEELRMVPVAANQNTGNVVNLEDYREPLDTVIIDFFDELADEFLDTEVLKIHVVALCKDKNGKLFVKAHTIC